MRRLSVVLAALAAIASAVPATAQSTWFTVSLSGGRQADNPGDSDGWGVAAVGVDGDTVRYYIWVTDIAAPTASHIHAGAAGSGGGIAIDFEASFSNIGDDTFVAHGDVEAGAAATAALLDTPAAFYINVHNPDHPAGAVRGQVLGDGPAHASLATTLRGFRAVGSAGDPDGDGFGVVTFDDHTAYFYFSTSNVAPPTAAHIHQGTAVESGGVVVDAAVAFTDGVSITSVEIDEDTERMILASPGHYYLNVHNADHPTGAIRGQLRITETVLYFPVMSRAVGQAGSTWTTGVRLVGLADEAANVYAEWFPNNTGGLAAADTTTVISLEADELTVIDDAVSTLFAADGNGAVKIASAEPFLSAARIFNDQRDNPEIGGTYGQTAPAYTGGDVMPSGMLLLGSNRPASDAEGFRTNVGYFNPWPDAVTVQLVVRNIGGEVVGTAELTLEPFANAIRGVFDLVPPAGGDQRVEEMLITFSASRPILMYLSAVDNVTNDAIFVTAEPALVLTP